MNSPAHSEIVHGKEKEKDAEGTNSAAEDKLAAKRQRGTKTTSKRRKTESTSTQMDTYDARPDGAHVKGRRGSLKFITEIPLDTLHEIFRNLEPVDLLHLSWASKSLHTIVMGKSARYIWQEASERLYGSENPPPPCPEDVNLSQYSHFLFARKCMECQTGSKCWVSWELRLRVCWNCLQSERFTNLCSGLKYYFPVIRAKEQTFCLTRDYRSRNDNGGIPDPSAGRAQLEARRKDTSLFREWEQKWEQSRRNERGGELDQLRHERQAAILNRLADVGWTESEVQELTCGKTNKLPGFKRAKKLTVKDWDALQPKLVEHLQELKAVQIERKLSINIAHTWRAFRRQFQSWDKPGGLYCLLPQAIDLAFYEPFKSAIFTPSEEEVEFSLADIDRVGKEWIETRNKIALSMLPEECSSRVTPTDGSQVPLLATFIFRAAKHRGKKDISCYYTMDKMCRERSTFFSQIAPEGAASSEELAILAMINRNPRPWLLDSTRPWLWDHKRFKFYPEAHELAKEMLAFLGLDPHTTTVSEMDRRRDTFKCRTCCKGRKMSWLTAIEHELDHHYKRQKRGITAKKRWQVVMTKD